MKLEKTRLRPRWKKFGCVCGRVFRADYFFCELKTATFAFLSSQTWNTRESLRQQR